MKEIMVAALFIFCASATCHSIVADWWIIAPVAFVVGFRVRTSGWRALASGALGAGALWLSWTGWLYVKSAATLAKIAGIFHLPTLVLPFVAAAIAALVAAFSCCAGYQLQALLSKNANRQ